MLLAKDAITKELEKGTIKIEPHLDPSQIREASIDLRLGNTFRVFKSSETPIPIIENSDYKNYTQEVIRDTFLLAPQATVLGVTMEKITLPDDICMD